jgi:hypothetical protein
LIQVPVSRPQPRRRSGRAIVLGGLVVCLGVAVSLMLIARNNLRSATSVGTVVSGVPGIGPTDLPPAFEAGAALAPLIEQTRASREPVARARAVLDGLVAALRASGARVVTDPDDAPPARTNDQTFRAVRSPTGRVTSLDLARLGVAVLRAAGTHAEVAERTRGVREDEPADPSGLLGAYVVLVADHAVDPVAGTLVAAREVGPQRLDGRALAGALLAQSALSAVATGAPRDRVLTLAEGAVHAWREGVVPLAVRAYAVRAVAATGGALLAEQDLAAAIARRDAAPLHLLRARLAVAAGDFALAASESSAALRRAPAWGPAALAAAVFAPAGGDAGDPCAPLQAAREPWTDDAFALCRRSALGPDEVQAAAVRLMEQSRDPLRVAFAAAAGATGAGARVRASERVELAGWLALLGRADLAREVLGRADAGR